MSTLSTALVNEPYLDQLVGLVSTITCKLAILTLLSVWSGCLEIWLYLNRDFGFSELLSCAIFALPKMD